MSISGCQDILLIRVTQGHRWTEKPIALSEGESCINNLTFWPLSKEHWWLPQRAIVKAGLALTPCFSLTKWPWIHHLNSWRLRFLIWKMGIIQFLMKLLSRVNKIITIKNEHTLGAQKMICFCLFFTILKDLQRAHWVHTDGCFCSFAHCMQNSLKSELNYNIYTYLKAFIVTYHDS